MSRTPSRTQREPANPAKVQAGKVVFNRRYGMRENLKLWAFAGGRMSGGAALNIPGTCPKGELLAAECSWTYGATENVLWEGVGAQAALRGQRQPRRQVEIRRRAPGSRDRAAQRYGQVSRLGQAGSQAKPA